MMIGWKGTKMRELNVAWVIEDDGIYINRLDLIDVLNIMKEEEKEMDFDKILQFCSRFGEPKEAESGDCFDLLIKMKDGVELTIKATYDNDGVYLRVTDLLDILLRHDSFDLATRNVTLFLNEFLEKRIREDMEATE